MIIICPFLNSLSSLSKRLEAFQGLTALEVFCLPPASQLI
jgi:hypothetical protein